MSQWTGPAGFSLLLWCCDLPDGYTEKREVILDAITLLSGRWGIEFDLQEKDGELYAFSTCSRFSVAERTVEKALGDMFPGYISFHKGPLSANADSLIRFQRCKSRWNVADVLFTDADGSPGMDKQLHWKRKKTYN